MAGEIFPLYLEHLDAALENFCESHWPCEHVDSETGSRCVNVKSGHGEKGHQNANGKIFADGPYTSRRVFNTLQKEFANNTYFRLHELLSILRDRRAVPLSRRTFWNDEIHVAADIHRDDVLTLFYRHVSDDGKVERYNSHSVCFCCLLRPPEHALPCGHVLCTQCISIYGRHQPGSRTEISIDYCPLEKQSVRAFQDWKISLKPDSAGVRILTLDGYVQLATKGYFCKADRTPGAVCAASFNSRLCNFLRRPLMGRTANYPFKAFSILLLVPGQTYLSYCGEPTVSDNPTQYRRPYSTWACFSQLVDINLYSGIQGSLSKGFHPPLWW